RVRGRLLRGGDPQPVLGEASHVEVDRCPLDAGSTDVDAQGVVRGHVYLPTASGRVRISLPSSVMRMVCSNWADRRRSFVTTVHPSSHRVHSGVPRLSIGSIVKVIPGSMTVSYEGAAS